MLSAGEIFTLFFVTLGPLKLLGPYGQQTRDLDAVALRITALRVFVVSLAAVLVGGYLGSALAVKWHVSIPAIEIATGVVFFLVAINLTLASYDATKSARTSEPLPPSAMAATVRLAFPLVVTPYGIAALVTLLLMSDSATQVRAIYAILAAVMVADLLAMLFVRQITRGVMLYVVQVLASVLGVLQVGLAVQIIIRGLTDLHVLS